MRILYLLNMIIVGFSGLAESIYLPANSQPQPINVYDFIDDDYFENYLTQFFDSVQLRKPYTPQPNYKQTRLCQCDGCTINNVCLTFLRDKTCRLIKGQFCHL